MKRRPTIIDVARLAGVSKTTVARVVNGELDLVREETQQRVEDAIQKLGYTRNAVARSLRSDRTFMIALSIPDITNPFWPGVARGVQDMVEREGFTVVFLNNDWNIEREHKHIQMMHRNQFDGLIINPTEISNNDLASLHIPVVILGSGDAFPDFDAVASDSRSAALLAFEHLFQLGHTRIGLIKGPSRRNRPQTRADVYFDAHRERGLSIDPSLIVQSEFTTKGGFDGMQRLLSLSEPPTAVFAGNDSMALGALVAAQQQGLQIPGDLSIVGMDDIYAAATTYPPLTTIAKPKYEIGVKAATVLLERLSGTLTGKPHHYSLPCELIIRSSTAPQGVYTSSE